MNKQLAKIALENLFRRRLRSWLTMIGIFIGIAAIVSLIGLGEGLREAIQSQFSMMGSDTLTITANGLNYGPPGSGSVTPLDINTYKEIENIDGVEFAINRLIEPAEVEINNKLYLTYVGSIPLGDHREYVEDVMGLKAESGRMLKDSDTYKVVVGAKLGEEDKNGNSLLVGDNILINGKKFEIIGVAKSLGNMMFDKIIMMNEPIVREVLDNKDKVSLIAVKVEDEKKIDIIKEKIEKAMRKERNVKNGEEDFAVKSAQSTLKTLDSTIFAIQLFVYIIASISLLVGSIGITNTMYTSVVERTKEIGIMKSIGAKNSDIFKIFFIESGFLGLVGGIIGILLGISIAYGLAAIGSSLLGESLIQAKISLGLILGSLIFSAIIGAVAGMVPAIQASKLEPVSALRFVK